MRIKCCFSIINVLNDSVRKIEDGAFSLTCAMFTLQSRCVIPSTREPSKPLSQSRASRSQQQGDRDFQKKSKTSLDNIVDSTQFPPSVMSTVTQAGRCTSVGGWTVLIPGGSQAVLFSDNHHLEGHFVQCLFNSAITICYEWMPRYIISIVLLNPPYSSNNHFPLTVMAQQ